MVHKDLMIQCERCAAGTELGTGMRNIARKWLRAVALRQNVGGHVGDEAIWSGLRRVAYVT